MAAEHPHFDIKKLNQLAEKKEEELREVKSLQMNALQKDLQEKDKFLKLERARFQCLKRDFEYNLKIIEERDAELLKYEKVFADLRECANLKNLEVSDMKITMEELKSRLVQSEKEKAELERQYTKRTSDLKSHMSHCLAEKNKEIEQEKDEYLKFKRNAERRIQESVHEMESQKSKLMFDFDNEMKKKENESQQRLDEADNALHAKGMQIKIMNKELEILREGSNKVVEEKGELGDQIAFLRKEISKKDWEIKDIENMAELKVTEFNQKFKIIEKEKQNMSDEFSRVYSNLDKMIKAKEEQFKAFQQDAEQKEEVLKNEIENSKNEVLKTENKLKQTIWDFNDRLKERDLKIKGLENVIGEMENKTKIENASLTQAIIARDLEIEGLKLSNDNSADCISKLKSDLKELKNDYKRLEECEILVTKSKEELELHWQKRYEEASKNAEAKFQNFISGLKDKLTACKKELEEKQQELGQRENLIKVLARDKDIAYSLLKKNGIELKGITHTFNELVPKDDLDSIAQQNEQLKNLVGMMRKEIENIEERHKKEISQASLNYASDLEDQVKILKSEKRRLNNLVHDLQEQVVEAKRQKKVTFFDNSVISETSESKQKLHTKMKSAAKQIQDLLFERDRLQSLGNKLRNEIVGLKKQLDDKETLKNISKPEGHSEIPQQVDLNRLEELHYQLAMEKLKDKPLAIKKDIDVELASSSESSMQADFHDGVSDVIEQVPVKDFEDGRFTENYKNRKSSTPTNNAGLADHKDVKKTNVLTSSSDLSSLQDLWKILDEAESLASHTPRSSRPLRDSITHNSVNNQENTERHVSSVAQVEGQQMVLQRKQQTKETKLSKLAQGKYTPQKRTLKIRNYNVKDDQ